MRNVDLGMRREVGVNAIFMGLLKYWSGEIYLFNLLTLKIKFQNNLIELDDFESNNTAYSVLSDKGHSGIRATQRTLLSPPPKSTLIATENKSALKISKSTIMMM